MPAQAERESGAAAEPPVEGKGELTTDRQVIDEVDAFIGSAASMTSPEIEHPTPENNARAARNVVALHAVLRRIAADQDSPYAATQAPGQRTRMVTVRDLSTYQRNGEYRSAIARVQDWSGAKKPPAILDKHGEVMALSVVSHVHIIGMGDEAPASSSQVAPATDRYHCWAVGVQGDMPVLFRMDEQGGTCHLDNGREGRFEAWGNGQHAATLTRLLQLISQFEDRPAPEE